MPFDISVHRKSLKQPKESTSIKNVEKKPLETSKRDLWKRPEKIFANGLRKHLETFKGYLLKPQNETFGNVQTNPPETSSEILFVFLHEFQLDF